MIRIWKRSQLWVASLGWAIVVSVGMIANLRAQEFQFEHIINIRSGLASNAIHDILIDDFNNAWVATTAESAGF